MDAVRTINGTVVATVVWRTSGASGAEPEGYPQCFRTLRRVALELCNQKCATVRANARTNPERRGQQLAGESLTCVTSYRDIHGSGWMMVIARADRLKILSSQVVHSGWETLRAPDSGPITVSCVFIFRTNYAHLGDHHSSSASTRNGVSGGFMCLPTAVSNSMR